MATEQSRFIANHKEYADIYKIICRSCREDQKIWVENDLVPKIQNAFVQSKPTPRSEFRILSIGSNRGSFDCLLLKALFSHTKELMNGKQVVYTVVEPNTPAIDEFKHTVESSQDEIFQRITFNWVNKRMEEFLETHEPERFDLIQIMHVLYYAENEEQLLKKAYEKFLATPGCIIASVAAEGNIWVQLMELFGAKVPSLSYGHHVPTNKDLAVICERNGWAHETFDAKLDLEVTEIFDERDPVGQAILKFFLKVNEDPKKKLGKELISEVMEFFRRISWEKIKHEKRSLVVKDDEGILLIYKNC